MKQQKAATPYLTPNASKSLTNLKNPAEDQPELHKFTNNVEIVLPIYQAMLDIECLKQQHSLRAKTRQNQLKNHEIVSRINIH